jgi:flagellar M-ring protein FliF
MTQQSVLLARVPVLAKIGNWPKPLQLGAVAAVVALIIALALWSQGPDYRVLFSNLDDQDGGAIVTALGQMNVPYQFSDNGRSILVPADKVYRTRMQLASQGLPRSGEAGFELLDKTRFGASQFTEQITYQRALEGELARSIEAINAIKKARVHLAIPHQSLFVRDRQTPTASVMITLYPGRSLSPSQVSAVTWLVSSSVPNLPADHVSIVDENGHLLTPPNGEAGDDATRRTLAASIEQRTVQRVLSILTPLVGTGNVRAQATADVDFTQREQTSETYGPNQGPGQAAVRSKQTSSSTQNGVRPPEGVPGALTNQAPANATADIEAPRVNERGRSDTTRGRRPPQAARQARETQPRQPAPARNDTPEGPSSARHDQTINYEVDHTIDHIKNPVGTLRRLSVAVVVNYRQGKDGKPEPLAPAEMEKINDLVRQAAGLSTARGDTISVVNSPFNAAAQDHLPPWKDPYYLSLAMEAGRYLLVLIVILLIWRRVLRPLVRNAAESLQKPALQAAGGTGAGTDESEEAAQKRASEINRYEENLNVARTMAGKDPRAVAMVLRSWMDKHGSH